MTATMQLSQELIDAIIGEVDPEDPASSDVLSNCCTVARSFLSASRARLWYRLEIPDDSARIPELRAVLTANPNLASLVRTIAIHCTEDWPVDLLPLFENVNHVELTDRLEFLPDAFLEHMKETWNLTAITFKRAKFDDLDTDLFDVLSKLSGLEAISFIQCEGPYTGLDELEDVAEADEPLSAPKFLHIDLTPIGASILQMVLEKSLPFTLDRLTRLSLAFNQDEGDTENPTEDTMQALLAAIPSPLEELSFHSCESLSMEEAMDVISIAAIPRISFDIVQSTKPLETIQWWTRSFTGARDEEECAIQEIAINVILGSRGAAPDTPSEEELRSSDVWGPLDAAVAGIVPKKVKICVQYEHDVERAEALSFVQLLREAVPLIAQRESFYFGDIYATAHDWHAL